jgi:hypothetical protein
MKIAKIRPKDIMKSLNQEDNRSRMFKAGEGGGKSGSFFFFSHDNRFIIKTLRGKERRILLGMLDKFIFYLQKNNSGSLIAKIFGCYRLHTKGYAPLDFIVMENITRMRRKSNFKVTFDLKGSTYGRETHKFRPQLLQEKLNYGAILKDLDFVAVRKHFGQRLLTFPFFEASDLYDRIQADSQFLADLNLMDYSFLLMVETDKDTGETFMHAGIIDFLQTFDFKKKLEYKFKTSRFYTDHKTSISCVPSDLYSQRFIDFLNTYLLVSQDGSTSGSDFLSRLSISL